MADVATNGQPKWQNLSAFMMSLASKQFYVTLGALAFEIVVLFIGTNLHESVTNAEYLSLVGVVHSFLLPVVLFWFKNDQENRKRQEEKGTSNASN